MITLTLAELCMWLSVAVNCWCIWGSVLKDRERVKRCVELDQAIAEARERTEQAQAKLDEYQAVISSDHEIDGALNESLRTARLTVLVHVTGEKEAIPAMIAAAKEFAHADARAAKSIAKVIEFKSKRKG